MRSVLVYGVLALAGAMSVAAKEGHAPYAGLDRREIAALSAEDVAALEAGEGWGLALAAELNGYPGPLHVLELAEPLSLSAAQSARMQAIFDEMQAEAVAAGAAFIAAERALDAGFAGGDLEAEVLQGLVEQAGAARAALRYVHLSRHLMTLEVLSADQVALYAKLRGYGQDDPCSGVPEGHDPVMWRQHNGCVD